MNYKFFSVLGLFLLVLSCNKIQKSETQIDISKNEIQDTQKITEKDLSEISYTEFSLDVKVEEAIENWEEYHQIQDVLKNIKKGDLSFFNNKGVLKTTIKGLKKNIPQKVNAPAIQARLKSVETNIYKLESLSNIDNANKSELISNIKDVLVAFSNLNFQMNKKLESDNRVIKKP